MACVSHTPSLPTKINYRQFTVDINDRKKATNLLVGSGRLLTPLQYVVGQRASHDLRRRLLQPSQKINRQQSSHTVQSDLSAAIVPNPYRIKTGAHLAQRVVLLLEPLEAALLRHGKTLPPAHTATAPAETLAATQLGIHSSARGPNPIESNQIRPAPRLIGWCQSS